MMHEIGWSTVPENESGFTPEELRWNTADLVRVHAEVKQVFAHDGVAFDPRGRDLTVPSGSTRLKVDCLISILRNNSCQTLFNKDTDHKRND